MKFHGDGNDLEQQSAKRAWQTPQLARLNVAETALGHGATAENPSGFAGCRVWVASAATYTCGPGGS